MLRTMPSVEFLCKQEGHLIAYKSRKLNETERKYTVQEKEMTAIVYCLRTWRHYLLGVVRKRRSRESSVYGTGFGSDLLDLVSLG